MKIAVSIVSTLVAALSIGGSGASTLRKAHRSLQNDYYQQQQYNNQWYYQNQQWGGNQGGGEQANGYYQDGEGQMYEDFEEYMRSQMAAKTFSFTGCSSVDSGYGAQTFLTYRLCEGCSNRNSNGCGDSNGDYVVTMNEFAETYREYRQQTTGMEDSPFECVRAEEYLENYYGGNNNNRGLQNYYNNGQQQNNEYFIGPKCNGKSVELGVFMNEWCSYPADGVSVKDVLGFSPNSNSLSLEQCISCTMSGNYNNNGEAELNPLCERMLERSGRCDRTDQSSQFDMFWEDVVAFVNEGGSTNFNEDAYGDYYEEQADYNQQEEQYEEAQYQEAQYQQEQYQQYQQAQYNGGNRALYNMNYNQYANQDTCDFIDSLPHSAGAWERMKQRASAKGISTGALIVAIFAAVVLTGVVSVMMFGWVSQKGSVMFGKVGQTDESEAPYHIENSPEESKPEVTIS